MRLRGTDLGLSATDLANFLACRHRSALDMAAAQGALKAEFIDDPLLELLRQRGAEHERQYVESLRGGIRVVVELGGEPDAARATHAAMQRGVDVIVQGTLTDHPWTGKPDVMLRVNHPSALGDWSYEISDTKLARETRAGTILQLGLYSALLERAQGLRPERFYVITPDAAQPIKAYRVADYAAYFRQAQAGLLAFAARNYEEVASENYPEPVDHCEICHWRQRCVDRRRADDHLSLVANITRAQRRELESRSVTTLTGLARLPLPIAFKPKRGSVDGFERARDQARLQLESRGAIRPLHELLAVVNDRGLCRLPEPNDGDLFLDLEGDPFGAGGEYGREYLFGVAHHDGRYESRWAFTDAEERSAFEWVMDTIATVAGAYPGMHVYHYAPYEPAAFKRLMGRYATREREIDAMLRAGRFVDLYGVVRQGLRAGIERYSIKNLEPLYGFTRSVTLPVANRALKAMELALGMGLAAEVPADVLAVVQGYNRDDCVSTLRLRDWLEQERTTAIAAGAKIPRGQLESGEAPVEVDERATRVEALRADLLAGVSENRDERGDGAQERWLLAYSLDYHRREDRSSWWEYFQLCDLPEEDLLDHRAAIAAVRWQSRIETVVNKKTGKPTGTVVDRYSYPDQEMEIEPGNEVWLQDGKSFGTVVAVDRSALSVDVRKTRDRVDTHPAAMFAFKHIRARAQEEALIALAEAALDRGTIDGIAHALLVPAAPRLSAGRFVPRRNETMCDFATRVVHALDRTVLAIQGPPGSGKTFTGARMICDLTRRGKRVGIAANSHTVIHNLLRAVAEEADGSHADVRLAHKCDEDEPFIDGDRIKPLASNADALAALRSGEANVVGGTAWLWARDDFANAVDVLFIDEAGQMALANALAVSRAADSIVLLGDPQQLEQPRKGSHPDGVGVSALEHILQGASTIPADRGIFLPETWRLPPSICVFTSELFYEGRLSSRPGLDVQRLAGVTLPGSGLALAEVEHDGNKNHSVEEVEMVAALVERLTAPGATWTNADGDTRRLSGSDILVVAPYNAHVNRLAARVGPSGVRVGTVDKFQGQEAPVVIYSMATSRPEDAPRGMEFLYSVNRLNVATSRARGLAVLVASPRLFEPECRVPRQMKLANALCRFRELATRIAI